MNLGGVRTTLGVGALFVASSLIWMFQGPSALGQNQTTSESLTYRHVALRATPGDGLPQIIQSNFTLSTELSLRRVELDTANGFDTATGQYQPPIEGVYLVTLHVSWLTASAPIFSSRTRVAILKNGTKVAEDLKASEQSPNQGVVAQSQGLTTLVYLDGVGDFLSFEVSHGSQSTDLRKIDSSSARTWVTACRIQEGP